jgi:hypothetical protein
MTRTKPTAQPATPPPMSDTGGFAALNPTDGQELMAAWELPPDAWQTTTVKTVRPRPGTRIEDLLESCPLSEWSLEALAARFGPGSYRVFPGPGPYRTKTATIHVADEYARAQGWGAPPPQTPRAVDAVAVRTIQQATQQPTNPLDLLAAMETMMDRREAALIARIAPQQQQNPMDAFAIFQKGFEAASSFTERGLALAQKMTGHEPAEKEPETWAGVVKMAIPGLLQAFSAMAAQRPAPAAPAAPQTSRPAQPPAAGTLPPPAPQAQPPAEEAMREITPETRAAVEALSPSERDAIAPAVGMFQPYAEKLVPFLGTMPAGMLADNVAGYIGPQLVDSTMALARTAERSPAILGMVHPALNSTEGMNLVRALAEKLERDYFTDEA